MPRRESPRNNGSLLKEAFKAWRKKQYSEAETILETVLENNPRDPWPWFFKAVLCLFLDRFGGTHTMLDRIEKIDGDYLPAVQLRAFMMMKAATSKEQAISIYADRIRKYPEDKRLRRGLNKIQNINDFTGLQKHGRVKDFVDLPSPPKNAGEEIRRTKRPAAPYRSRPAVKRKRRRALKLKLPLTVFILFLFTGALSLGGYFFFAKFRPENLKGDRHLETLASVELSGNDYHLINRVNRSRTAEFYTSPRAVKNDFNRARHLIKKGRYNEAVEILNRIYNSNATFPVREKTDFLIRFVMDIEHRDYESIEPSKLQKKAWLYRGWGVRLRGKVSNLKQKPGAGSFTLLINYRKADVFDGIADIFFKGRKENMKNGKLVTVDGLFAGPLGKTGSISITARDIRGKVESDK